MQISWLTIDALNLMNDEMPARAFRHIEQAPDE
jgi:hypothetical protein